MVEALGYRIQSESHEEALARTTLDGASATCREGMTMTETTSRGATAAEEVPATQRLRRAGRR
jgi:hypothetical protein